jgi:DNA-binding transcriptional LysR family regulator
MALTDRLSRKLKVRDLQMVEIISAKGSMARAAIELGLSQPAISKAVADLEHALGASLFERSTRGVQLTDAGIVLMQRGRVIMDELRHGVEEIANITDPTAGLVRVGVSLAQSQFIASVIGRATRRYPKIKFSVVMADPLALIQSVRDRELDLVVCRAQMTENGPDLKSQILFRDRTEVVVAPSHPLARRRKLDLADLLEERWALTPPDTYLSDLVRQAFTKRSLPMPKAVVSTSSIQLRFELMDTAGFVTLSSRSMALHPSRRGRIKVLPVGFDDDAGPMAAITLRAKQATNVVKLFIEEARQSAQSIAAAE